MTGRTRLVGIVFLLVVMAGAACSDSQDDEAVEAADSSSSTSTTTAAPDSTTTSSTTAARPSGSSGTTAKPAAASPTTVSTGARPPSASFTVQAAPLDPAQLDQMTDELVAAETALRDPATPDAEIGALARRQQAVYRAVSARPAALPDVLKRVPEALRPVVEASVTAGAELRSMTKPRTELPSGWKILPPPPAAELQSYYRAAEAEFGVPWAYLAAVHLVETRMGRIRGDSTAGAKGPMQFLPATWKAYGAGGNIEDPRDSIMAAGRYLHANGAPGDMANALWHYNHSDRYGRAVTTYAQQIQANERIYLAYYHWQVYYITVDGDVLLEEGYGT